MPTTPRRRSPDAKPGDSLNLEKLVAPLLRKTFEIRRAYEKKLRLLTELQQEIDVVRSSYAPFPRRRQSFENIEFHFRDLAKAAGAADDLLKKLRAEFDEVHQEMHAIEKEQLGH